jgi:hypothetical protein
MLDKRSDAMNTGLASAVERIGSLEQQVVQGAANADERQKEMSAQLADFKASVTSQADATKQGLIFDLAPPEQTKLGVFTNILDPQIASERFSRIL